MSRHSIYYQQNKGYFKQWKLDNRDKIKGYREQNRKKDTKINIREQEYRRALPGLTQSARDLINKVEARTPQYDREGVDVGVMVDDKFAEYVDPRVEQVYDKDSRLIRWEEDEDDELEAEDALFLQNKRSGGRRGLKAQAARASREYYQRNREAEIERSKVYSREHPEVRKRYSKHSIASLRYNIGTRRDTEYNRRLEVKSHYGKDGKPICAICGETREPCLTVDFIGVGMDRSARLRGGDLYRKLESEGFPEGYQTICKNCQSILRGEENDRLRRSRLLTL